MKPKKDPKVHGFDPLRDQLSDLHQPPRPTLRERVAKAIGKLKRGLRGEGRGR